MNDFWKLQDMIGWMKDVSLKEYNQALTQVEATHLIHMCGKRTNGNVTKDELKHEIYLWSLMD